MMSKSPLLEWASLQDQQASFLSQFAEIPYNPETAWRQVSCLDIETLGLGNRSVILEAGVVTKTVNFFYEPQPDSGCIEETFSFNRVEQEFFLGRVVEPGAEAFLRSVLPIESYEELMRNSGQPGIKVDSCHLTSRSLVNLQNAIKDSDEIWVNHLAFDIALLNSLYQECKLNSNGIIGEESFVHYKKVQDVSIRKVLLFKSPDKDGSSHRGVADSHWNFKVLEQIGALKKLLYYSIAKVHA